MFAMKGRFDALCDRLPLLPRHLSDKVKELGHRLPAVPNETLFTKRAIVRDLGELYCSLSHFTP